MTHRRFLLWYSRLEDSRYRRYDTTSGTITDRRHTIRLIITSYRIRFPFLYMTDRRFLLWYSRLEDSRYRRYDTTSGTITDKEDILSG
jgi:hypothetical protein